MKKLLLLSLSTISIISAPIVLLSGTNIVGFLPRANTPTYFNSTSARILLQTNDWINGVTNYVIPPQNWSWPGNWKLEGTNIVQMTPEDIATITDAQAVLQKANFKQQVISGVTNETTDSVIVHKATLLTILNEINILRGELVMAKTNQTLWRTNGVNLQPRTINQLRNAILNQVEEIIQ